MLRNCVRQYFCLDRMVSSKLHFVKEKDAKTDYVYYEQKTVFSKEKGNKKYKLLDVKVPDINVKKTQFYVFDKNTVPVPRQVYTAPLRKYVKQKLQRDEFVRYKKAQTTIQEQQEEQVDELWGENPPIRYFERLVAKDLFFNYRSPRFAEYNNRKNDFLSNPSVHSEVKNLIQEIKQASTVQLSRIYHPNYFIEDHYKKLPDLFTKLKEAVSQANFKEIPKIAWMLQSQLLYKEDIYKIWEVIENIVKPQIHHYSVDELILLKRGLATTYPKAGSYELHNLIYNLVSQEKLNVDQTIEALYAFRTFNNDKYAKVLIDNLITLLPEYKNNHSKLAQAFYSIANNLPKKHLRAKSYDVTANDKYRLNVMNAFVGPLKEGKYNMDDITRILLGISILKVPNFNDLIFLLENQLQEPDEYQLVHILYALSKGNNGIQTGTNETYKYLEQFVLKYFDQYEHLEKSRIYYAYSSINSEFAQNPIFLNWVKENMLKFSFSELQNVVYGLMFNQVNDQEIWSNFLKNVATKSEYVPLANYYAFKQAKFYITQFYPNWNLKPFEEACQNAENMFLANRTERQHLDQQIIDFQIDLNTHLQYDWKTYYNWNNTYFFNITLPDHRVAIILNTPRTTINGKPRAQLQLQQQVMATQDWKLLIFDQTELFSMKTKERAAFYKKTIDEAIESQKEKMKAWEEERRDQIYEQLLIQAENGMTPGKRFVKREDLKGLSRFPV
ncbi:unnamed protein product [Paramecium primaurelia]|uniref:Uncharacterized protein n=1 Tax=Paramecium primaurelia TaxID=5886 RepID=A0A8S1M598_PARPR|nr:unnamed protein product [Paramecium primaurelia]